jgi:release factor glutamine methyltransferase
MIEALLQEAGIARTDAEILLASLLKRDRSWLLAHRKENLTESDARQWETWRSRRARGEPVAYITGTQEFFGRPFLVTPDVLIPRPATEGLVRLALDFLEDPRDDERIVEPGIIAVARKLRDTQNVRTIADIGTGSGCIAVTLALERQDLRIIATDVSEGALAVARANAKRLGAADRIEFLLGDLLEPLSSLRDPFLLVSNPPYIAEGSEDVEASVRQFEPHLAVFAGTEGTEIIARLTQQAEKHPACAGIVLERRTV